MKPSKISPQTKASPSIKGSPVGKPKSVKASTSNCLPPQDQAKTGFIPSATEVAYRAYLNYQNHGAADGRDVQDWLGAEAELIAESRLSLKR